ncbi:MAG: ABC transporter permease [Pseudomonadota bacterium]
MFEDRGFRWAVAALGWLGMAFIVAPVLLTVLVSFNDSFFIEVPPNEYSLRWYYNIGAINKIWEATLTSLGVALASATLVTILGLIAALALTRHAFPAKPAVTAFLLSPVTVPIAAIGIALIQFFLWLDIAFTWASLVIGHMVLVCAYPVRTIVASLTLSNPSLEEAAASLGANRWTAFWTITLPQLKPGIVSGFLFAFLISFDNYPISVFLVRGGLTTMPIEFFGYISQNLDPTPAAFSTIYILVVSAIIIFIEKRFRVISVSIGERG